MAEVRKQVFKWSYASSHFIRIIDILKTLFFVLLHFQDEISFNTKVMIFKTWILIKYHFFCIYACVYFCTDKNSHLDHQKYCCQIEMSKNQIVLFHRLIRYFNIHFIPVKPNQKDFTSTKQYLQTEIISECYEVCCGQQQDFKLEGLVFNSFGFKASCFRPL